jgi:hypothetical protein
MQLLSGGARCLREVPSLLHNLSISIRIWRGLVLTIFHYLPKSIDMVVLGRAIDAIFWERGRYAKMQM